jgi:hypothetical protein
VLFRGNSGLEEIKDEKAIFYLDCLDIGSISAADNRVCVCSSGGSPDPDTRAWAAQSL